MTDVDGYAAAGYEPAAMARYAEEPPKDSGAARSPFARDRARILHSAAFRRLAAKTQVHQAGPAPAGVDDFPRTRLTHSLEVAQIAREMGQRLGCDADVVDSAGLAHDLGHPPFGHNGEAALDELARGCGGFEGNAQTLRVVTRLEVKVVDGAGASVGLNLTRATLDAAGKYPWPRGGAPDGGGKFGVYADDRPVFDWLRAGAPDRRPCLEAQVMDWADDVAYSVHDIEDGVHGGYLRPELLADPDERAALCQLVAAEYSTEKPVDLAGVLAELLTDPVVAPLSGYDGGPGATIALKRAASALIGRFVDAAVGETRCRYGTGPLRRYAAELVVPRRTRAECALLKGMAWRYVLARPDAARRYQRQRELLHDLVTELVVRAPDALDALFAPRWRAAVDDAARLRVVIDQVASLTDTSAVAWYHRLTGSPTIAL
ncbi:deoxyguanosinetriphosphate triphosphohydrolase [Actinocatenispora sera]|uniref:Deoxyguanosinetriphosphate triphosphohydrolase-like protein n=1 Tax=Actinocatenispora sera TaxID=390989 RepID=A0A810L323_9ACTN|nr:deoxyguanosinetriphosphate triphosphohydrolase [Actinocatenispora sera]BCJ29339.1 deoxyguanosinetriphosphate triphosphohydrolase-like protein [Actinocatenispora sera]